MHECTGPMVNCPHPRVNTLIYRGMGILPMIFLCRGHLARV